MSKMDDDHYRSSLNAMIEAQSTSLATMINGLPWDWGLRGVILRAERPYADQNAQADIEGRPRPVHSYGIDKGETLWKNKS